VYLDDLDPNCLNGGIEFQGLAYSKLWDICEQAGLVVVGDVHSHPGSFVRQSSIDSDNPMVAQHGHVAIIIPYLATRQVEPVEVGVHRYEGHDGWKTWVGTEAAKRLKVSRWF
jgi:proteasome lid subunit RPN8/RPN11